MARPKAEIARPGPHPLSPLDLAAFTLPTVDNAGPWSRIYRRAYDPLYFGRTGDNRFDAPDGEYGVLYAGNDTHCAFVETFGDLGRRDVTTSQLDARCLARLETGRPLTLIDLTGPGLARLGADERLCSGDHGVAQQWALALWAHPSRPDGLLYRARHDPSRYRVALYDRVADTVRVTPQGSLSEARNRAMLADLLDTYTFALVNDSP
ncbi:MAG: RES family NAD+ phosphorylase [Chloroflexota bacterium]|nr:RES family NAD+ phosphorylase [Chloroflexota bacterium]